ncbi:YeiH family protein [Thermodesulfovibrionales bacterium]|nr:YeiH family protein [Thermodesulfovibrionales bacterium]
MSSNQKEDLDKDRGAGEIVTEEKQEFKWSSLVKHEDYWAIWLGSFILVFAFIFVSLNPPADLQARLSGYNAIILYETERAPFRTIAHFEATHSKAGIRARNEEPLRTLRGLTDRPKTWTGNPISAFYMSDEAAAVKRAAAADEYERAKEALVVARAEAERAEAAAEAAGFQDFYLNRDAAHAIAVTWQEALSAKHDAQRAATIEGYNMLPSLAILGLGMMLFFAVGMRFMGHSVRKFCIAFPVVFVLAVLSYFLAHHEAMRALGLSYVLFALIIGFLISNTIGTPRWLKPAVQTEYYIKTGLVLLGAAIMIGKIALIGIPGVFVTWVVTPIVLICTYIFGQHIIKVPSKELNITVSADMSVSGVSAAIAAAAASRAKKEELTLAIGMSMVFVAIMIFVLPAIVNGFGMHHVWGGAWIGGTVDNTGSVVAAGELIGPIAMYVAATIKMIQNITIGALAFGVAAYWALKIERERSGVAGQIDITFMGVINDIWSRFPKFILGFLGASVVVSVIYGIMGHDWSMVMIDQGVTAWAARLRGWFFALAFISIGLATNFRELAVHLKGGKPVILYVTGQTFNLLLTLVVAYVMFFVVFPGITERIAPGM